MTLKQLLNRLKLRGHKSWKGISALGIILLAGVLIEAISLLQYRYTHRLFEDELDYRAESELTLKSVRVRSMLKSNEKMVHNYILPIRHDSDNLHVIYGILRRLVANNEDVMSCFVSYVPGYFSGGDELVEPCAIRLGDTIVTKQIADEKHDYT